MPFQASMLIIHNLLLPLAELRRRNCRLVPAWCGRILKGFGKLNKFKKPFCEFFSVLYLLSRYLGLGVLKSMFLKDCLLK